MELQVIGWRWSNINFFLKETIMAGSISDRDKASEAMGYPQLPPSSINGITAFAGGGQASATQLSARLSRVTTVATAADSVKLPPAVPNRECVVINAAAANAMNIFPQSGEIINALAADAAISCAANKVMEFFCAVAGTWNSQLTA